MPSIKLPESEANDMRRFYEEELEKTVQKLQHIKSVLEQLGGSGHAIDIKVKTKVAPSRPIAVSEGKKKKRPGRKSVWDKIILERFKQLNRPMTYEELTDEIMTVKNYPAQKRLSTKQAIMNVAFRMRTRDRRLDTFSIGQREKYLAPMSWFDDNGSIKNEYLQKIEKSESKVKTNIQSGSPVAKVSKPAKGKVGRPRGKAKASNESAKKSAPGKAKRGRKPAAK